MYQGFKVLFIIKCHGNLEWKMSTNAVISRVEEYFNSEFLKKAIISPTIRTPFHQSSFKTLMYQGFNALFVFNF